MEKNADITITFAAFFAANLKQAQETADRTGKNQTVYITPSFGILFVASDKYETSFIGTHFKLATVYPTKSPVQTITFVRTFFESSLLQVIDAAQQNADETGKIHYVFLTPRGEFSFSKYEYRNYKPICSINPERLKLKTAAPELVERFIDEMRLRDRGVSADDLSATLRDFCLYYRNEYETKSACANCGAVRELIPLDDAQINRNAKATGKRFCSYSCAAVYVGEKKEPGAMPYEPGSKARAEFVSACDSKQIEPVELPAKFKEMSLSYLLSIHFYLSQKPGELTADEFALINTVETALYRRGRDLIKLNFETEPADGGAVNSADESAKVKPIKPGLFFFESEIIRPERVLHGSWKAPEYSDTVAALYGMIDAFHFYSSPTQTAAAIAAMKALGWKETGTGYKDPRHTCAQCQKRFIVPGDWSPGKDDAFCSVSCAVEYSDNDFISTVGGEYERTADPDYLSARADLLSARPEIEKAAHLYLVENFPDGVPDKFAISVLSDFAIQEISEFCGIDLDALPNRTPTEPAPLGLLIYCPACGMQHIDAPEPETGWTNPPHTSHKCKFCEKIFRLADFPTYGVAALEMSGKNDNWKPDAITEKESDFSPICALNNCDGRVSMKTFICDACGANYNADDPNDQPTDKNAPSDAETTAASDLKPKENTFFRYCDKCGGQFTHGAQLDAENTFCSVACKDAFNRINSENKSK